MTDQARVRETRRARRHEPIRLGGPGVTLVGGDELRRAAEREPGRALRPGRVPDGVAVASPAVMSAALHHGQVSAATMMTYPFSAMGRVMARPKSGGSFGGVCTGVLVGPNLVLTATHLLRDRPLSDWTFQFVPAYHGGALGGNFKSPPAVASWALGRLDIVGIGLDGAMYQKTWDGSRWLPS